MILTLLDISHEKRRNALDRIFFHDVNNLLNVVVGYTHLIEDDADLKSIVEDIKIIQRAGTELVNEVASHQSFLLAERGELSVNISSFDSLSIFEDVMGMLSMKDRQRGWKIVVDKRSDRCEMTTDQVLLRRVLGMMVKNTLEVTAEIKEIHLACQRNQDSVVYSAHSAGYVQQSANLQMSQTPVSVKEKERDIRTYTMKLCGEKYLKGSIWGSATPEKGTTYCFSLPLKLEKGVGRSSKVREF